MLGLGTIRGWQRGCWSTRPLSSPPPKDQLPFPSPPPRLWGRAGAFCTRSRTLVTSHSPPGHTCFERGSPRDRGPRRRFRDRGQSPGAGGGGGCWRREGRDLPEVPEPLDGEGPHAAPRAAAVLVGAASAGERGTGWSASWAGRKGQPRHGTRGDAAATAHTPGRAGRCPSGGVNGRIWSTAHPASQITTASLWGEVGTEGRTDASGSATGRQPSCSGLHPQRRSQARPGP